MVKLHMDLTVNVSSIHVTMKVSTVISVIVHFIHAEILQLAENGLKVKVFGTVRNACGYTIKKQLNA